MPAKKKPTAKERLAARKAAADAPATTRIVLVGFGDVGKNVAELLISTKTTEYNWAGVPCAVVAVADSRGAVYTDEPRGFDLSALLRHKRSGASVHTYGGEGAVAAVDAIVAVNTVEDFDVLFEASPVNLETGGVGLAGVKAALAKGKDAVLANKAPLVLAYAELHAAAAAQKCRIEFSATVCGGLPVVNIGRRDTLGSTFQSVEGIFNSTSNYILHQMELGNRWEDALKEAQRRGIAEADPTLDVEGFDTANKLVIIANAVLGCPAKLADVDVKGITAVTESERKDAADAGEVIRLVASATPIVPASSKKEGEAGDGGGGGGGRAGVVAFPTSSTLALQYTFKVEPRRVPATSFLGSCIGTDMGIIIATDTFEVQSFKTNETGVTPTSAAMLRDMVAIARERMSTAAHEKKIAQLETRVANLREEMAFALVDKGKIIAKLRDQLDAAVLAGRN